jgi:hypothetical protein
LAEATEIFPMSFAVEDGDTYVIPEVHEDLIRQKP